MTLQQLTDELQAALTTGLKSVLLYGSAVAGDHISGKSDYNILVVAEPLGVEQLKAVAKTAAKWTKAGNRPPLLFTPSQLAQSADVFPIEILDMQQASKVLFGENPLKTVKVDPTDLRLQIERELKTKLLRLRERYMMALGDQKLIAELLTSSLSSFTVLFRAALRLWQNDIPTVKSEAVAALAMHVEFDTEVFAKVKEMKEGKSRHGDLNSDALFAKYLVAIETIAEAVDRKARA